MKPVYKIGDKVRIIMSEGGQQYVGKIGTIVDTDRIKRIGGRWDYLCAFDDELDYPFGPPEMERVIAKGQQLVFEFMN